MSVSLFNIYHLLHLIILIFFFLSYCFCLLISVSTVELTSSFGWDMQQGFEQHDANEFVSVLLDKLEQKVEVCL